jgi:hypothetical protein
MPFTATINVPGYLPMDDEPAIFETAREAWDYLADERERGEDYTDEGTNGGTPGRFETTLDKLRRFALPAQWSGDSIVVPPGADWPVNVRGEGTVYGDTPGYGGNHDLGLAYSVTSYTDEDAVSENIAEALGVTVTIVRSAGSDGAVVVMIDTEFEPDASDSGPGLRVLVNDGPPVYEGVEYKP